MYRRARALALLAPRYAARGRNVPMGATVDLASVSGLVHLWAVLSHPVELISGYLCVMVIQMCYVLMTQAES